jgi:hypothetical protein
MYKIVRHFQNSYRKYTVRRHLTLEQAQAHCSDPETSSSTAKSKTAKARTRKYGAWFDGYTTE